MNIPNFITIIRILLVPLLVIALMEEHVSMALSIFLIAGVSDGLDGFLARVLHQKTTLGAYIDPLADKLLISTSFVTLAILDHLPGWLAVLVASRDIIIVGGVGLLLLNIGGSETEQRRGLKIRPTIDSKVTTFIHLVTICFFIAHKYVAEYWFFNKYLIMLSALFALLSGLHYLFIGFRILNKGAVEPEKP